MADDNTLRSYRPNDPFRRDAAPASGRDRPSDPLVELARLIGQSDPFAEFGRGSARESTVRRETPASADVPNWRGTPPPYALMRARTAPPAPPPPAISPPMVDYADEHRYASQSQYDDKEQAPAHHQDAGYDDMNYAAAAQDGPAHEGSYYEDSATVEQPDEAAQDEAAYDDPPRPRRRNGMLTALTLIGCAMVGTAGAYGYRNYYAGPRPSSSTPVIVADKTPTKVVLASDPQSSKIIQDRVGDGAVAERMVPREEQPVVLKVPTPPVTAPVPTFPMLAPASTASIEALAAAPPPGMIQAAPPATVQAPPPLIAPPPSNAASEPKRVRTVTIRSDSGDVGRSTGATPRGAAPKAARGAPLQLEPQLSEPAAARSAPVTPPAPRVASVPAGGSGGYVVQVSSQKSEAEAHASFRAMQAKYSSVFSGHSPVIRRADLGAKGVFYRALVGPFPSSGDAGVFCSRLKAAGGQCIVQKN